MERDRATTSGATCSLYNAICNVHAQCMQLDPVAHLAPANYCRCHGMRDVVCLLHCQIDEGAQRRDGAPSTAGEHSAAGPAAAATAVATCATAE